MLLLVFAYAMTIVGYGYSQTSTNESLAAPVCLPGNAYAPNAQIPFLLTNLIIVILILLVYGAAQYKIRTETNSTHCCH